MKRYLWIILAACGLFICGLTHLYELLLGQLPFWLYLGLLGLSLALLLTGVIWGLVRVFGGKKPSAPQA